MMNSKMEDEAEYLPTNLLRVKRQVRQILVMAFTAELHRQEAFPSVKMKSQVCYSVEDFKQTIFTSTK